MKTQIEMGHTIDSSAITIGFYNEDTEDTVICIVCFQNALKKHWHQ